MNKTKEESSLMATQRAGQALAADFCCWHALLVDAELVASCTLENCPLQHAQTVHGCVKNPAHIVLRPGVTLADLKQAFGKDDWSLFKDNLPALRSALNQLAVSKHPAGALHENGAVSHYGLLPHEREPDGPLVVFSEALTHLLVQWVGFSKQEAMEVIKGLLSDVAPGSIEQGQLLCDFMLCHFQGLRLFADHVPVIPKQVAIFPWRVSKQVSAIPWLSTAHGSGLELFDLSITHLNHLAQLVRDEPLRLDLHQRRLQQKRLLERNVLSSTHWCQDAMAVTDSTAAKMLYYTFISTLSPMGLTSGQILRHINPMVSAMPSVEPIETLVKMQRLLIFMIIQRLGSTTSSPIKETARVKLLRRYQNALARRDKALKNWYACRDGTAAGSRRAHT